LIVPPKIPGLKLLLIVWGVYTAVWISLEGALWRVVLMGAATTILTLGYLVQRYFGGKTVSRHVGLLLTAVSGLALGGGSGLLSLIFMAVKTGLHTHGPEFSRAEISWVLGNLPLWTAVGLLVGLGLGLIWIGKGTIGE
jgi:hypothetical protein